MSLRKKIILSFLISSTIIAVLALTAYITFVEIRKEIRFLELADSLRSKTLQLRRHEKNFFLYRDPLETTLVHDYIVQINAIVDGARPVYGTGPLVEMGKQIETYEEQYNRIEDLASNIQSELNGLKHRFPQFRIFFPIIESTILERPLVNARLLENMFSGSTAASAVKVLRSLHTEILGLRKTGEEIVNLSKDLDRSARAKAERGIALSQKATLLLFPLSLVVGLGTLFMIGQNIVKRLEILRTAIENTARGDFLSLPMGDDRDEVGVLMKTFNKMESALVERDREIAKKNEELYHSKKLASIGTLASGVAHELNNPLNNIYLSAQVLSREMGMGEFPPIIRETVEDIFSQTLRVKRIVSDLLEFSREKAPVLKEFNLTGLIEDVTSRMMVSNMLSGIELNVSIPRDVNITADRHLMEQVFINLLINAVDAMAGIRGTIDITVEHSGNEVAIRISDTGKGIPPDTLQRIFDPFYTTKEKGTGLGLAIVYNIIRKHNGSITVESSPGKGTTFTIFMKETVQA